MLKKQIFICGNEAGINYLNGTTIFAKKSWFYQPIAEKPFQLTKEMSELDFYISDSNKNKYIVFHDEPQKRTIRLHSYLVQRHLEELNEINPEGFKTLREIKKNELIEPMNFFLSFPYIYFGAKLFEDEGDIHAERVCAFVSKTPIKSMEEKVFRVPLPNIEPSGKICMGTGIRSKNISGLIKTIRTVFWTSTFNDDILQNVIAYSSYPTFKNFFQWQILTKSSEENIALKSKYVQIGSLYDALVFGRSQNNRPSEEPVRRQSSEDYNYNNFEDLYHSILKKMEPKKISLYGKEYYVYSTNFYYGEPFYLSKKKKTFFLACVHDNRRLYFILEKNKYGNTDREKYFLIKLSGKKDMDFYIKKRGILHKNTEIIVGGIPFKKDDMVKNENHIKDNFSLISMVYTDSDGNNVYIKDNSNLTFFINNDNTIKKFILTDCFDKPIDGNKIYYNLDNVPGTNLLIGDMRFYGRDLKVQSNGSNTYLSYNKNLIAIKNIILAEDVEKFTCIDKKLGFIDNRSRISMGVNVCTYEDEIYLIKNTSSFCPNLRKFFKDDKVQIGGITDFNLPLNEIFFFGHEFLFGIDRFKEYSSEYITGLKQRHAVIDSNCSIFNPFIRKFYTSYFNLHTGMVMRYISGLPNFIENEEYCILGFVDGFIDMAKNIRIPAIFMSNGVTIWPQDLIRFFQFTEKKNEIDLEKFQFTNHVHSTFQKGDLLFKRSAFYLHDDQPDSNEFDWYNFNTICESAIDSKIKSINLFLRPIVYPRVPLNEEGTKDRVFIGQRCITNCPKTFDLEEKYLYPYKPEFIDSKVLDKFVSKKKGK